MARFSRLAAARKSLLLSLQNVYETLAVSAGALVEAGQGKLTPASCDARLEAWSARVIRQSEIEVTVSGRERIEVGRAYVIMSNHQSHMDVPVLYHVLGGSVRMVAKKELFALPLFGRAMREAGFISVDRENRQSAIANLEQAKDHLAGGTHIWIAPEGTRSTNGELLPFKKGGFVLALETGAAILPITLRGTRDVLPAKGLVSQRGIPVHVTIHAPIETAPFKAMPGKQGREALVAAVRSSIARSLNENPDATPP